MAIDRLEAAGHKTEGPLEWARQVPGVVTTDEGRTIIGHLRLPRFDINQDPVGYRTVKDPRVPPDTAYRLLLQKADISFRTPLYSIGLGLLNLHLIAVEAVVPVAETGSIRTFLVIQKTTQREHEMTGVQEKAMSVLHERADAAHETLAILEKLIPKSEDRLRETAVEEIIEQLIGATSVGIEGALEAGRGVLNIGIGRANGNESASATCTDGENSRVAHSCIETRSNGVLGSILENGRAWLGPVNAMQGVQACNTGSRWSQRWNESLQSILRRKSVARADFSIYWRLRAIFVGVFPKTDSWNTLICPFSATINASDGVV